MDGNLEYDTRVGSAAVLCRVESSCQYPSALKRLSEPRCVWNSELTMVPCHHRFPVLILMERSPSATKQLVGQTHKSCGIPAQGDPCKGGTSKYDESQKLFFQYLSAGVTKPPSLAAKR